MLWRRRLIRTLAGLITVCAAHSVVAAPPNLNLNVISANQALSAADQARVEEYVTFWTGQLANGQSTPAEVAQAAQQLIDPVVTDNAGAAFLSMYSSRVMPALENLLTAGGEEYRAVLAAKAMGFLGTPDALEELSQWCSLTTEKRAAVRLWASRGCQLLITRLGGGAAGGMSERQINTALRRMQDAAIIEEDWLVMHRQFQAMAAANNITGRQRQLEAFKAVADRVEKNGDGQASALMNSLTRVMHTFRNQFISLANVQQQTQFGAELAPLLGNVYDIAMAHWEAAQEDPEAKKIYGLAVQTSESLLRFIDQSVRAGQQPPSTALYSAWNTGNRPKFESESKSWQSVLQAPPYAK